MVKEWICIGVPNTIVITTWFFVLAHHRRHNSIQYERLVYFVLTVVYFIYFLTLPHCRMRRWPSCQAAHWQMLKRHWMLYLVYMSTVWVRASSRMLRRHSTLQIMTAPKTTWRQLQSQLVLLLFTNLLAFDVLY